MSLMDDIVRMISTFFATLFGKKASPTNPPTNPPTTNPPSNGGTTPPVNPPYIPPNMKEPMACVNFTLGEIQTVNQLSNGEKVVIVKKAGWDIPSAINYSSLCEGDKAVVDGWVAANKPSTPATPATPTEPVRPEMACVKPENKVNLGGTSLTDAYLCNGGLVTANGTYYTGYGPGTFPNRDKFPTGTTIGGVAVDANGNRIVAQTTPAAPPTQPVFNPTPVAPPSINVQPIQNGTSPVPPQIPNCPPGYYWRESTKTCQKIVTGR